MNVGVLRERVAEHFEQHPDPHLYVDLMRLLDALAAHEERRAAVRRRLSQRLAAKGHRMLSADMGHPYIDETDYLNDTTFTFDPERVL